MGANDNKRGNSGFPFFPKTDLQEIQSKSGFPIPKDLLNPSEHSMDVWRKWIVQQRKVKGFVFSLPVGNSENILNLTGTARFFLGLSYVVPFGGASLTQATLIINNEEIITGGFVSLLSNSNINYSDYHPFPRPLFGSDEIRLQHLAPAAESVYLNMYYI